MLIEASVGEVVDKATILAIKVEKFTDSEKRRHVADELALLTEALGSVGVSLESPDAVALKEINEKLWHIEDDIRVKELRKEFDDQFIQLARAVYFVNDDRAAVKKRINVAVGSRIVEEKQYVDYKQNS